MHRYGYFANRTKKNAAMRLECGHLFLVHAGCTKIVHRLSALQSSLQRMSQGTGWELKKRVARHLMAPVFHLCYLLFKFAHPIGERRLLLLASQCRSDGIRKLYLNCRDGPEQLTVVGKSVCCLDDINGGLCALDGSDDFSVHRVKPNVMSRASRAPEAGRCSIFWPWHAPVNGLQTCFNANIPDEYPVINFP